MAPKTKNSLVKPKSRENGKLGGRPKGAQTKRTVEIAKAAAAEGLTPIEYMLSVMRDETAEQSARLEAAKASAPYIHPRLSAVELSGSVGVRHEDALKELE